MPWRERSDRHVLPIASETPEEFRFVDGLAPEHVELAANLARVLIRLNRPEDNERTRKLLHQIVAQDQRPDWIPWARKRLALMPQPPKEPKEAGEPRKLKELNPTTKPAETTNSRHDPPS